MYYCSILVNIHPMLGCDWHMGTPGPPVVPFTMPHFVAQVLGGFNTTAKLVPKVLSHNFIVLNHGTDIGPGIGHVASNILFPLYVLTSKSSSNFGSFTVLSGGKPTAAAVGIYVNMNLNCGQPVSTPTGLVVAPGSNMVGMTGAEVLAGFVSIAVNMAISFVLDRLGKKIGMDKLTGRLSDWAIGGVANIVGRLSASAGLMVACAGTTVFVKEVVNQVSGAAIAQFTGLGENAANDAIMNNWNDAMVPSYREGELIN